LWATELWSRTSFGFWGGQPSHSLRRQRRENAARFLLSRIPLNYLLS
jgi:hypothetical protein